MAAIGERLTSERVRNVLLYAWSAPFSTKSDFARAAAQSVAEAACRGLITTRDEQGAWGRFWRITPAGAAIICPELSFDEQEQVG